MVYKLYEMFDFAVGTCIYIRCSYEEALIKRSGSSNHGPSNDGPNTLPYNE